VISKTPYEHCDSVRMAFYAVGFTACTPHPDVSYRRLGTLDWASLPVHPLQHTEDPQALDIVPSPHLHGLEEVEVRRQHVGISSVFNDVPSRRPRTVLPLLCIVSLTQPTA
jgi:hypothetical protein